MHRLTSKSPGISDVTIEATGKSSGYKGNRYHHCFNFAYTTVFGSTAASTTTPDTSVWRVGKHRAADVLMEFATYAIFAPAKRVFRYL
jgi:hypothetical protein